MALRTGSCTRRNPASWIAFAAIGALVASGCGGSGSSAPPPPSGYTVSGSVSGASSVTVTLGAAGVADRTTTTGSNGTFSFAGVASGTYTVQAAKPGFTMAPLSRVVTVAGADVGGVSFAATASTGASSTISGTITKAWGGALANVTVTLTAGGGSTLGTALTDATGRYAFAGVPDGSYGVMPSLSGYVFTPSAPTVAVSGADVTQNFSANGAYTITGTVTTAWGSALQNVSVALSGGGVTKPAAVTAANGTYTIAGVPDGSFTVTPALAGYAFTPAAPGVTVSGASATRDFTADGALTLAGTVTTVWGAPVAGVSVALSGGGVTKPAAVTGASGTYSFAVPNGTFTLTPTLAGSGFTPASPSVAMAGASKTQDFTASGAYAITGVVTTAWGTPLQSVSLTIGSGGSSRAVATTDASGGYTIAGLPAGSYTVTPSLASYAFTPSAPTVVVTAGNQTRDFSADGAYAISGTVTGVAVSGVSIALSGGGVVKPAAVTGSDGKYTLAGLPNGTYTLTPTLPGYTISPGSPQVVVSGGSQVQDFTSSAGPSYSIGGTLTGLGGAVLPGMTVRLSGSATGIQTTDASGAYTFSGLAPGGTYTVAPAVFGYTFTPAQRTFASLAASQTASFVTTRSAPVTFTGTLSYAGTRSGPVYVTLNTGNGAGAGSGTGLVSQAGPWSGRSFTIRNATTQFAPVTVWMDTLGIGHFNAAADPSVTVDVNATTNPFPVGNLTLLDPVGIPSVNPGDGVRIDEVVPFDGGAVVAISAPMDVNGHEAADGYRVYWNTAATVDAGHNVGSLVVPAGGNLALVKGLTNGTGYWFRVVAYAGATPLPGPGFSTPSSTVVGPSTGPATVSGTVAYPALPSPSAIYVVAAGGDKGPHYVQRIANPGGAQTGYSLSLPTGTYRLFAIVDLGDDGYLRPGEPSPEVFTYAGTVTLSAGSNGGPALTVPSGKSTAAVYTTRWQTQGGMYSGSALQLDLASNLSPTRVLPLAVSLTGPGIPGGLADLAADSWGGSGGLHVGTFVPADPATPIVGERYAFGVTYTDGTTDAFSMPITGLFGSAPTLVAPADAATGVSTTPTFQWLPPTSPPAAYGYQLAVGPQNGQNAWSVSLPSGTNQVAWNADGRALGSQLAALTAESWTMTAVDVNGNTAGGYGTFTTGLPQLTTYDPLAATTLDGKRWQTPQYARTVVGGQALLAVRADDMQGRLVQGLTYNNALNVLGTGSPVTTLRSDIIVPAAGAFRDGATATLIGGIRLNYQAAANRGVPFPAANQNLTTIALEFFDAGSGPLLRARGYHCDTSDCTSFSSTGITFSSPPAGFTQEGVNVVASAAYDTLYTLQLSVNQNSGVVTWTVSGGLSGSGTIDLSTWIGTAGIQLASTTNGFASAQLLARAHDESVGGGGSAGFTPEFDNVYVAFNGGAPALYDDFETLGSTDASGLAVTRWLSDRAVNGSVDATGGVHLRASYLTANTNGGSANTALTLLFPAPFTTLAADLTIVSDTGMPGLAYVQLGGAFLNDGSGALHNATGDHLANVILHTTGASYWIGRCGNATCTSQATVRSGTLTGGSVPFDAGTTHTVAVQWDPASMTLGFLVDDGTPTQVAVPVLSAVPPCNPGKYVQSAVSILSGNPAGTSAAIDAIVANVRVVP